MLERVTWKGVVAAKSQRVVVVLGASCLLACSALATQKEEKPSTEVYPAVDSGAGASVAGEKAPPPAPLKLPPLLVEIEAKYSAAATLEANFVQVNEVASMNRKKTSAGILWLKRPDKFRWQTNSPDPNLLVSDGKSFWFYTPPFDEEDHGQVVIRKSSEVQTDLARALLAGSFSAARDASISPKGGNLFIVVPKPGSAGTVQRAEVQVNLSKKIIEKVTLLHQGGNRSEITLSQVELGKKLDDSMFIFTPPPRTEVLKQ